MGKKERRRKERKEIKKLKKDQRSLIKQLHHLKDQLENTQVGSKRKDRSEKKKEGGKNFKKQKHNLGTPSSTLLIKQVDVPQTDNKPDGWIGRRARGNYVRKPGTRTKGVMVDNRFWREGEKGKKILISDGSKKANKTFYRYINQYIKKTEPVDRQVNSERLTRMLTDSMKAGNFKFETNDVPRELLEAAAELYKKETGDTVLIQSTESSRPSTVASSDVEGELTPADSFMGQFEHYVIDCRDRPNNGFIENLSSLTDQVNQILNKSMTKFGAFRFYMDYKVVMERTDMSTNGVNQREVTLSTSGEDGSFSYVAKADDIATQVGECFGRLLARASDYAGEGSGWNFVKSLELHINVSNQVFGITQQAKSDTVRSAAGMDSVNLSDFSDREMPPLHSESEDEEEDERPKIPKLIVDVEGKGKEKVPHVPEDDEGGVEKGGSYIPLPEWVRVQGACVNPKPVPPDNRCFEWCVVRAFNPLGPGQFNPGNVHDIRDKMGDLYMPPPVTFPIPLKDRILRQIEEMNPDFSFSIFRIGQKKGDVSPMYISENRTEGKKHIQLGLISQGINYHFVLISNGLSRLFPNPNRHGKRFFCERCIMPFSTQTILDRHTEFCGKEEPTKIEMPVERGKDHFLSFDGWRYTLPQPWVAYADFEAVIDAKTKEHTVSAACYHIRCRYKEHEKEMGFDDMPLSKIRIFTGKDSLDDFLKALIEDAECINDLAQTNLPCKASQTELADFNVTKICHVCKQELLRKDKVLDHDHYTGEYRGAAHSKCNLQLTSSKYFKLPVFFHNLKGYDGFFVMKGLARISDQIDKIEVIAKNLEKYTTISVERIRFLDSMQFLTGSLDNLVSNYRKPATDLLKEVKLKEYYEKLVELFPAVYDFCYSWLEGIKWAPEVLQGGADSRKRYLKIYALKMLDLATKKGIYPYEWMDSYDKLQARALPPIEDFFSSLYNASITPEDYAVAQRSWEVFKCRNMKDYTKLYCTIDVLLLETLFEGFRASCFKPGACGLDSAHFVTAPSLSWQAMLKKNFEMGNRRIENMVDVDMLLMVEGGIRGGMCQIMNPFARATPKEVSTMEQVQDETLFEVAEELDSRILYWDANNLYGWAMSQPMPEGNYIWEKDGDRDVKHFQRGKTFQPQASGEFAFLAKRFVKLQIDDPHMHTHELWQLDDLQELSKGLLALDPFGPWGYILEVDISYPPEMHDILNDYPPCPTHKAPTPSPFTQREMRRLGIPWNSRNPTRKLVCDLEPRKKYVIHYRSLQQAILLGVKLDKVHRVIGFQQSTWLRDYIMYNTDMRKLATNSIERDFWKLLNNSIFGKTIEQVRKRRNIKFFLAKDFASALKQASGPFVKHWRIIEQDKLIIMETAKKLTKMNRPLVIGQAVLDVSKWLMFDFHYNYVRKQFGSRAKLLYTDTDSLVYKLMAASNHTSVGQELVSMQRNFNCFDLSEMKNKEHDLLKDCQTDQYANKAVLGKFKDEMGGATVLEFIAVRSKMYSVLMEGQVEKKRNKGLPEKAVLVNESRKLKHEDFVACMLGLNDTIPEMRFNTLRNTKDLRMQTQSHVKKGLSACDDKSFYLDAVACWRYGHHSIGMFCAEPQMVAEICEEQQKLPLTTPEEPLFDEMTMEWLELEQEKYATDPMNY